MDARAARRSASVGLFLNLTDVRHEGENKSREAGKGACLPMVKLQHRSAREARIRTCADFFHET